MENEYVYTGQYYDLVYGSYKNDIITQCEVKMILGYTKAQSTILDIGAGTGRLTIPLLKNNRKMFALDTSEAMLKELRKKLKKYNLVIGGIINDKINDVSLKKKVDCVVMFGNVISEMAKTREEGVEVLRVIKGLMKKNSKLIISQSTMKNMDWKSEEEKGGGCV